MAVALGATCTLDMTDSYGDGWNGAEWAAPGFGQSFSLANGRQGTRSFVVQSQAPSPPSPTGTWVSGSGCAMVGRCVRSTGYGDGTNYLNNEACTIHKPPAVPISVTNFAVDGSCGWSSSCMFGDCCSLYLNGPIPCSGDYLSVNGYAGYCETSPQGVVPDPSVPITWQTDGSGTMAGWELCF